MLAWKNIWSRYKREANILQKGGSGILWLSPLHKGRKKNEKKLEQNEKKKQSALWHM